jgi:hypothetical protein
MKNSEKGTGFGGKLFQIIPGYAGGLLAATAKSERKF